MGPQETWTIVAFGKCQGFHVVFCGVCSTKNLEKSDAKRSLRYGVTILVLYTVQRLECQFQSHL